MNYKNYLENYVKAYENHFNNEKKSNITWEKLQYAGWLIDKYCSELNLKTWYKGCYEDCKKLLGLTAN